MERRAFLDMTDRFAKPIGVVPGDYVAMVGDPGKEAGRVVSVDPVLRQVWVSWTADEKITPHDPLDITKLVPMMASDERRCVSSEELTGGLEEDLSLEQSKPTDFNSLQQDLDAMKTANDTRRFNGSVEDLDRL